MKKYSANRISLFISAIITVLVVFILLIESLLGNYEILVFLSIPVFFILTYFIIWVFLNKFIYEKIKPLYRAIREPADRKKSMKERDEEPADVIAVAKGDIEKWTKKQIKELERLKDLEKYRKEFVGNVSHELKTPIFNIQGYILTLLEGGLDDPNINKLYLERAEKSVDRMISIVEDLESITKLESGEMTMKMEAFDIVKMTDDVFELEQMLASDRKISLEYARKPDRPVLVRGDKKRIMEVMTNLVVNGIKYGKKKGFVNIAYYDLDDNIMVEVRDNGIGIEEKDLSRVFERFYRVDKSRSREQGGTGLGLSIVKHIIEAHNQTINVKSIPDEGTTFTFTLEKAK